MHMYVCIYTVYICCRFFNVFFLDWTVISASAAVNLSVYSIRQWWQSNTSSSTKKLFHLSGFWSGAKYSFLRRNIFWLVLTGWTVTNADIHPSPAGQAVNCNTEASSFWQQRRWIMNETVVFCQWFVVGNHVQPLCSLGFIAYSH